MKLFVYGTLKHGLSNHMYLNRPSCDRLHHKLSVRGYKMYRIPGSFPMIVESDNKDDVVFGELYEIDDSSDLGKRCIQQINHLEGYSPDVDPKYCMYIKKPVAEDEHGEPIYAYVWNRPIDNLLHVPSGEYAQLY